MSEKDIRGPKPVEIALAAADVDVLLGTFFLAAVALHACIAVLVVTAKPRPRVWSLLLLLVAMSGGSAFARAWWAFAPDAGAGGWFHRVSVDLEWPLSFVVLAIAWYARGTPPPRHWRVAAALVVGGAWLFVIFRKDLLYGEPLPGYPIETDWRAFLVDRLRYYLTMGAAFVLLGTVWARNPSSQRAAGILLVAFAFGPLQAAPEVLRRGIGGENASVYDWTSDAMQLTGPLSLLAICLAFVVEALRRDRRAGTWVGMWLSAALFTGLVAVVMTQVFRVGVLPGFGEIGYLIVRPALLAYGFVYHGFGEGPVRVPPKLITTTVTVLSALAFIPVEEIVRRYAPVSAELALPLGVAVGLTVSGSCFLAVEQRVRGQGPARPRLLADRYRVIRDLGAGASGAAFECVDEKRSVRVAVKVIPTNDDPLLRQVALREAEIHAGFVDPHLVRVRETHVLNDAVLIVMDLARGGSLASRLRRNERPLASDDAERILRDVLLGLKTLHAAGIAHGDLKPSNVLIADDGRAMLGDFGIARRADAATLTGLAGAGTPAYMAPEVLLGGHPDARADVFATGILLHECLVGRPPRRQWTSAGIATSSLQGADLPTWARLYVEGTTTPASALRPKDAADAVALLDRCLPALAEKKQAAADPDHVA